MTAAATAAANAAVNERTANDRRTACLQRRSLTARGERTPLLCPATDERGRSTSDAFPFPHVVWGLRRSRNVQSWRALDPIARNPPGAEHVACSGHCQLRPPCSTFRLEDAPTHSAVCTAAPSASTGLARPELHAGTRGASAALGASSGPALRSVASCRRLARSSRSGRRSPERVPERGHRLPSRAPRAAPRRGSMAQSVALPGRAKEKGPAGGCSEIAPTIPWELNRSIAKRQGMTSACKARCISIKNARI